MERDCHGSAAAATLLHPEGFPDFERHATHEQSKKPVLAADNDRRPCVLGNLERISIANPREPESENGKALRIGIYIVLIEAADTATGGVETFKVPLVVARKL